jgi:hypothetical protein
VLPSGRLLIAENHAQWVTERDCGGRIIWQWRTASYPLSCWRLDSGNTFVVNRDGLVEVTPEGKTAWSQAWEDILYCGRRLRDGEVALLKKAKSNKNQIVVLDRSRRIVRRTTLEEEVGTWTTLTPLANEHFLVAGYLRHYEVAELDAKGKVVWTSRRRAITAVRLPDGQTVTSEPEDRCLRFVDRTGKLARELRTSGRPWHVQVLP